MRTLPVLLALSCTPPSSPDPLGVLEVGGLELDVGSGRRYFAVSELDLGDQTKIVARPGDPDAEVTLRWETITGQRIDRDAPKTLALEADQRVVIEVDDGEEVASFLVTITPADMPVVEVTGTPTEHFVFLTPRDWTLDGQLAPFGFFLLIVDGEGTPVWWRRTLNAAFDFKVAGDGMLTANAMFDLEDGILNQVIDPHNGALLASRLGPAPDHWKGVRTDPHEYQLRADGSVLQTIQGATIEDMSALGGEAESILWHSGVQELDPDGKVVARWTTEGNIDFASLPDEVWASEAGESWWRYGHVNSVQAVDGGLLMSLRSPNQVVLVDPATGAYQWKVGGADSDVVFVDDPRNGFYGQHSARIFEPGRLLVFDNGTNFFSPTTGDVRAVEYALDFDAGTATRTWEYALEGAGGTDFAGLIQQMSDGGLLIGWGSTQEQRGERSPSVTILDADRNWESDLRLPAGTYTYRAYAFRGDPIAGVWQP